MCINLCTQRTSVVVFHVVVRFIDARALFLNMHTLIFGSTVRQHLVWSVKGSWSTYGSIQIQWGEGEGGGRIIKYINLISVLPVLLTISCSISICVDAVIFSLLMLSGPDGMVLEEDLF